MTIDNVPDPELFIKFTAFWMLLSSAQRLALLRLVWGVLEPDWSALEANR